MKSMCDEQFFIFRDFLSSSRSCLAIFHAMHFNGCGCCYSVAIIICASFNVFFAFKMCVRAHTKSNGFHLYTCLCSSLSPSNYYCYYFVKSFKSTLFNTHSDSINCRNYDLWPLRMQCFSRSALAKTNSCQFICLLLFSYRILVPCPVQRRKSLNWFSFAFTFVHCLFFTLFLPIKWFLLASARHRHIFSRCYFHFTVALSDAKYFKSCAH